GRHRSANLWHEAARNHRCGRGSRPSQRKRGQNCNRIPFWRNEMRGKGTLNWWRILGLVFALATSSAAYAQDADSGSDHGSIVTSELPSDENRELKFDHWTELVEERLKRLEKTNRPVTAVSVGSDGFVLQSSEGDQRLQIGLLLQADGQFSLSDSNHQ